MKTGQNEFLKAGTSDAKNHNDEPANALVRAARSFPAEPKAQSTLGV